MVEKRLPKPLIERIQRIKHRFTRPNTRMSFFMRLKNADARAKTDKETRENIKITNKIMAETKTVKEKFEILRRAGYGLRVRSFDVSRNYPEIEQIILKTTHGWFEQRKYIDLTAQQFIDRLKDETSRVNNLKSKNACWKLDPPFVIPIDKYVVAMVKTKSPIVGDMYYHKKKGKQARAKLKKEHPQLEQLFDEAVRELEILSHNSAHNFVFSGVKDGELVFTH